MAMIRRAVRQPFRPIPGWGGYRLAAAIGRLSRAAGRLLKLAIAACTLAVFAGHAAAQQAASTEKRIALVVGNAKYASIPLDNPENDARLVAKTLRNLGFQVSEHLNLKVRDFRRVLRDFARVLQDHDGVAVVYYAGHGVQIDGRNYLLPVDINLRDEEEVKDESVDLEEAFVSRIERARSAARIIILDACRDNPFRGKTRNIRPAAGLAEMSARGALIAYASAPGAPAEDGPTGSNSVFTRHLVEELQGKGVEVEEMFKNVRVKVLRDTNQRQMPWVNSSLTVKFYFNPGPNLDQARAERDLQVQETLLRLEQEKQAMQDRQAKLERELGQRMKELEEAKRALQEARKTPSVSDTARRDRDRQLLEDLDRQERDLRRLQEELARERAKPEPQRPPPRLTAAPPPAPEPQPISRKPEAAVVQPSNRTVTGQRCADLLMRAQLGEPLVAEDRAFLRQECSR
jgi:uncharacterized caspase-like protein